MYAPASRYGMKLSCYGHIAFREPKELNPALGQHEESTYTQGRRKVDVA
jgi:hypothetical protein